MASWRDTTSETAQNDLDALLNAVLPFAEQSIGRYGEFFPFGATVGVDGQIAMAAAGAELSERAPSQQVLDVLYDGARQRRAC